MCSESTQVGDIIEHATQTSGDLRHVMQTQTCHVPAIYQDSQISHFDLGNTRFTQTPTNLRVWLIAENQSFLELYQIIPSLV